LAIKTTFCRSLVYFTTIKIPKLIHRWSSDTSQVLTVIMVQYMENWQNQSTRVWSP